MAPTRRRAPFVALAAATAAGLGALWCVRDHATVQSAASEGADPPATLTAPVTTLAPSAGIAFWDDLWSSQQAKWHRKEVNPSLRAFYGRLFPASERGPVPKRVLVPLCGKTVDMAFLREQGHEVVGVEGVESAALQFFTEQQLNVAVHRQAAPGFDLLTSADVAFHDRTNDPLPPISVFVGDFFHFPSSHPGLFDVSWDRGAFVGKRSTAKRTSLPLSRPLRNAPFVTRGEGPNEFALLHSLLVSDGPFPSAALEPAARPKYVEVMATLMRPGGRILLDAFDFDETRYPTPPFTSTPDGIRSLWGRWFWVEEVGRNVSWKADAYENIVYVLVRKERADES